MKSSFLPCFADRGETDQSPKTVQKIGPILLRVTLCQFGSWGGRKIYWTNDHVSAKMSNRNAAKKCPVFAWLAAMLALLQFGSFLTRSPAQALRADVWLARSGGSCGEVVPRLQRTTERTRCALR
jgi:hypothetical protein